MFKVLIIHGYRQNAQMSKEKTGAFRKGLKKYLDCTFITAPNQIQQQVGGGATPEVESEEYGWWFSKQEEESSLLSFNACETCDYDEGHQASINLIRKTVVEQGPFDGILGFSQGATMVAHICSLAEGEEEEYKSVFNFKFAILCAGFKSRSSLHAQYYTNAISIPTLHVFGDTDQVISKDLSVELSECFNDKEVVRHKGGHFIPATAVERKLYQQFLDRFKPAS